MTVHLAEVRNAAGALVRGDLQAAERALRALGPAGRWAREQLAQALHDTGKARQHALHSLATQLLRAASPAHSAPLDHARLLLLLRDNQMFYSGTWMRVVRLLQNAVQRPLAEVSHWLAAGHHALAALAVLSAALLVGIYLRVGRLLPQGAAHAAYGSQAAAAGPQGLWRTAQDHWKRGERLQALSSGRAALLARLDRDGVLRAVPGLTDRELELSLAASAQAEIAREFRRAYAYGRWAERGSEVEEAWRQLGLLWQAGDVR